MPRYLCRLGTEIDGDGEKRVVAHPPGCGHGGRADRAGIDGTRPGKAWDNLGTAQRQQVAVKPFAGPCPGGISDRLGTLEGDGGVRIGNFVEMLWIGKLRELRKLARRVRPAPVPRRAR